MSLNVIKTKRLITQEQLLNLLKFGALITVAITAPNAVSILKPLFRQKDWREYYPYSVNKTLIKLLRKGLVEVKELDNGHEVVLTENGKTEILKFDLNSLTVKKPERWDDRWRMVFFDIPEKFKNQRDFLSQKLKAMNFFMMQKSVFVHPFPCDKEIKFLREVLGIGHYVKIGIVGELENSDDLKRIFRPLLQELK